MSIKEHVEVLREKTVQGVNFLFAAALWARNILLTNKKSS